MIIVIPKILPTKSIFFIFVLIFFFFTGYSQVGIGTVNPNPSSMLDVSSTSQGILAPRMTTAQRVAISNPANGLLVYDLDEQGFYFFEGITADWVTLNSSLEKRDNFVLIKSLADFPAPSGGVIQLDENTYYEINGVISLAGNSIDLNNAYLAGLDEKEDMIVAGAGSTAFQGNTGGNIRKITITGGGTAFNITGSVGENLILQNTIVANMNSVGTISGLGLYFSTIVQYIGNGGGVTYSDIGNLFLSNQAWLEGNVGTYETFTGTFALIEKVSGFSVVGTGATGIDVSSNPAVGEGVILNTLFTGAGTYVDRYTIGSYPQFNFNNSWGVECPGIPLEIDAEALGNIYITAPVETDITTQNVPVKINGTTTAVRMFRTTSPASNRIVYQGSDTKVFNIQASLSGFSASSNTNYTFFIAKNGAILPSTGSQTRFLGGGGGADVRALSFTGTVEMAPDDYVEVFVQNDENTDNITVSKLNLLIY